MPRFKAPLPHKTELPCLPSYKIIKKIGGGAYSDVYSAIDKRTDEKVALKHIKRVFTVPGDEGDNFSPVQPESVECPEMARRIWRELVILTETNHPHVAKAADLLLPNDLRDFDELWIVMPLAARSLDVMKPGGGLTLTLVRRYMYQLVSSYR